MQRGAQRIMQLFISTIVTAFSFHNFLHLPPDIASNFVHMSVNRACFTAG